MNMTRVKLSIETNKISQDYSYIVSFAPETKCYSRLFQKEIWPVFYRFICDRDTRGIVFDLNNVDFISPHVLTKLCCLGMIANQYGKKVEMLFNPVSKIKDYLGQMNFFTINEKHVFIYIDEGLTGGEIGETGLNKIFLVFDKSEY